MCCTAGMLIALSLAASSGVANAEWGATSFQTPRPYEPSIDIGADTAIVYGVGTNLPKRLWSWRDHSYQTAFMTGISWGEYEDYYGQGKAFKKSEVQTQADGSLLMHHPGVGYNVPTAAYVEFIKTYLDPAITEGVRGIFLEEPEYWSLAGWSGAFKAAWKKEYGEPWQPPSSSVEAQYKASRLKYEMYYRALDDVTRSIKKRAKARGLGIGCYVPTHSLVNYAHWRIVSPESHLLDLPALDGLIAQVWTGTAATGVYYRGLLKSRFFEYSFLEYGQMAAMVRPSGKPLWFLADPVEDNPGRAWPQYRAAYEQCVVASLMWPEVSRYEVMPWPERVFTGLFPGEDGDRTTVPASYATELLAVINALNDMNQPDTAWDTGSRGIGLLVSDTMMFQRSEPHHSDHGMGGVFGLALPLVKAGVPVEPVQLEHAAEPGVLDRYGVLLLTYEHQKPLDKSYHRALVRWVRRGGALAYIDAGTDGYNAVPEWWNKGGRTAARPCDDLLERLGATEDAERAPQPAGKGFLRVIWRNPSALQHTAQGADAVRECVAGLMRARGDELKTQNRLAVRRGPYVAVAVLDETPGGDAAYTLSGTYVDLFDPALPVQCDPVLAPGDTGLFYDLAHHTDDGPRVLAAACRVCDETCGDGAFSFTTRGPSATQAVVRVQLPQPPTSVTAEPEVELAQCWDAASGTVLLSFPNQATDVRIRCTTARQ